MVIIFDRYTQKSPITGKRVDSQFPARTEKKRWVAKRRTKKKCVLLIVSGCILAFFLAGSLQASEISDKKAQILKSKKSIKQVKKNLTKSMQYKMDVTKQLEQTKKKVDVVQNDMETLNSDICETRAAIRSLNGEVQNVETRLQEIQVRLQTRVRDLYIKIDEVNPAADQGDTSPSHPGAVDSLRDGCRTDEQELEALRREKDEATQKQQEVHKQYRRQIAYRDLLVSKVENFKDLRVKREDLLKEAQEDCQYYLDRLCELEEHTTQLEKDLQKMLKEYQERSRTLPASAFAFSWPANGPVTSDFGYRTHPIFGGTRYHTGLDIGADDHSAVKASDSGTVVYAGWLGGYGNAVMIDHGAGVVTLYGHCSVLGVKKGQEVEKGKTIAAVGSTGNSTGPHLHFEVRQGGVPMNPHSYLR